MSSADFIKEWFEAYQTTNDRQDKGKLDIALRKSEFENTLNEMWDIYISGATSQIVEYNKQVAEIKRYGYKVLRNSSGVHKLVLNK